jgi:hypothetical protein
MPKRPLTAVLAALALLAAAPVAARAQDPPENATREVERIYGDFSDDGVIEPCDHELEDLQEARDTIEPEMDQDYPDFRAALEAGINDHFIDSCNGLGEEPTATATPGATTAPSATPDAGTLPPTDDSGSDDTGAIPPEDGKLPPQNFGTLPEDGATPAPPAPTPPPPAAATTPAASPTPVIVSRSATEGLLIPGILLGIALLGALALGAFALAARRSPRFEHAWREAAFRTRGTWADFSDWLKLGR